MTPQVPSTQPAVAVRPTAKRALRDVAAVGAVTVVAIVVVMVVAGSGGSLSLAGIGLLLSTAAVGAAVLAVAVRRWGRAQVAELQHGYTTSTFKLARFWVGAAPDGPVTHGWVEWDWSATWVMDPAGAVVSPPSSAGDPPGLYPSPRRDGALELWTGHQWTGYLPKQ